MTNLEEFCKKLETAGIKLDRPIEKRQDGSKLTFIHDPWGTSIELTTWAPCFQTSDR